MDNREVTSQDLELLVYVRKQAFAKFRLPLSTLRLNRPQSFVVREFVGDDISLFGRHETFCGKSLAALRGTPQADQVVVDVSKRAVIRKLILFELNFILL